MTKYILNSGGIRNNPEGGKKFFAEVIKDLGNNPKVLICLFAYSREHWSNKFNELKNQSLYPENINPIFDLAFPDEFENQIKNSDVLYMYGGDDHLIQYWLNKFDIPKIWEGKVVATSSCSSQAISKYFWTCDWRENMDGIGVLPIKFISHYQSDFGHDDPRGPIDWGKSYEELKEYKEDLPIYALKEGEFVIFEQ